MTLGVTLSIIGVDDDLSIEPRRTLADVIREELRSANLCRCTGYQNIVTAVRAAQAVMRTKQPGIQ